MATWRVFKQQDPRPLPEAVQNGWWEYGTIETSTEYWVDAETVGKVAGAGTYLLVRSNLGRALTLNVREIIGYEEIRPEPEPEEQHSVAVTE